MKYLLLFVFISSSCWIIWNTKKYGIFWLLKSILQVGLIILFGSGFFKLFNTISSNVYIKILYCLTYLWCTIGINVNFMIPLVNLIDRKINKR